MILMHAYTFRAYDFEHAVRKSLDFGYDGVELVGSHYSFDTLESDCKYMKHVLDKYGQQAQVAAFGPSLLERDPEKRKINLDLWERGIRAFSSIGVGQINGGVGPLHDDDPKKSGSAKATDEDYELAAEGLRQLVPKLRDAGMTLSLEIHMNTLHDTARTTKKLLDMVDALDTVYANPDPGNMFSTPHAEPAVEAIKLLEGYIGYFHLKNCLQYGPYYSYSTTIAAGHIDFYKVFEALKATGFKGAVCIEYCGAGDPAVAAEQDLKYIRSLLDELDYEL